MHILYRSNTVLSLLCYCGLLCAVGIKNTSYAVGTMLLADLVGTIIALLLCCLFLG
jgi:spore maturation protein SpmB